MWISDAESIGNIWVLRQEQAVKGHLRNICGKLEVSKRREAVDKAMRLGILTPLKG